MILPRPKRAMILAAGHGKRLRPLTTYYAKPAMPLLGRPILDYALRKLAREGIEDVVVNLHHRPETLEPVLDRAPSSVRIHRSREPEILGTAGGLKRVEELLKDEPFLLVNGDTLSDFDLRALVRVHASSKARATLLLRAKPGGTSYSGIRLAERSRIAGIERASPGEGLMFGGVWLLDPSVFRRLSPEPRGLEERLLLELIEERSAYASVQASPWITVDTPRRYWEASLAMVRDRLFETDWAVRRRPHEVVDGAAARVLVGADVRIEEGVRFRGTVVLGERCRVAREARLENVVCWDDVSIASGVTLSNSVVTHGVTLPAESELRDKIILKLGSDRSGLRRREILDDLVIAELKTGRSASL